MATKFTLAPTMNSTITSIQSSTKTAFSFFKKTITPLLKTLTTQNSKKISVKQVNLLCTFLWRNGKVKSIDLIQDIIDVHKVSPLTLLEKSHIKNHFSNLRRLRQQASRQQASQQHISRQQASQQHISQQQASQQHISQQQASQIDTKKSCFDRILTLSEMSRLNLIKDQYINLTKEIVVDTRVSASFRKSKRYYPGIITSIDKKKMTCCINFDDGDVDTQVPFTQIRIEGSSNIVKIISVDLMKITCIRKSGQIVTLLNDGTILSKMTSFKVCFSENDDMKSMMEMSNEISHSITQSWIKSDKSFDYTIDSNEYTLTWSNESSNESILYNLFQQRNPNIIGRGVQMNKKTRKKRNVFLLKWEPLKDMLHEFKTVNVGDLPKEYGDVVKKLLKSCPQKTNTIKIYHLEPQLYGDKKLELECQIQKLRNLKNDTKVLVHGCSEKAIENIVVHKTGFQDVGVLNGKVYGRGIYFSSDPQYSARDYCSIGKRGTKMMLLCKVLIGGKEETFSNFRMFTNEKFRTGGSLEKGYDHIYMKPFSYVNDINIAYLLEF